LLEGADADLVTDTNDVVSRENGALAGRHFSEPNVLARTSAAGVEQRETETKRQAREQGTSAAAS